MGQDWCLESHRLDGVRVPGACRSTGCGCRSTLAVLMPAGAASVLKTEDR